MNPPAQTPPSLDATCDRVVAALTRRLARAARARPAARPPAHHDFLVPVMHPELAESLSASPGGK